MKKTIEIDKNSPNDVRAGDMLYLHAAPDRAYAITRVDPEDGDLPYCIDAAEHMDETTRHVREILDGVACDDPSWASPILVSRITRTVDVPEWPTPEHNTAYRGADGRLYVYMSDSDDDGIPWLYDGDDWTVAGRWKSAEKLSREHSDALPLTELVPKGEERPAIRRITDIREVRVGFIVFAKGCATPFVCERYDSDVHDISSARFGDAMIRVTNPLPAEFSSVRNSGSLVHNWLRNDMFDYAIDPIEALGFGGGDEKC